MKLRKYAVLFLSGGMLLGIAGCGRWVLDALYLLPQFTQSLQDLTGAMQQSP
jgi:hypothetical protein